MKLYCVFGVEYHVSSELLGIYDNIIAAEARKTAIEEIEFGYNAVEIIEYELNEYISCE
jgi:hypothetical protein